MCAAVASLGLCVNQRIDKWMNDDLWPDAFQWNSAIILSLKPSRLASTKNIFTVSTQIYSSSIHTNDCSNTQRILIINAFTHYTQWIINSNKLINPLYSEFQICICLMFSSGELCPAYVKSIFGSNYCYITCDCYAINLTATRTSFYWV